MARHLSSHVGLPLLPRRGQELGHAEHGVDAEVLKAAAMMVHHLHTTSPLPSPGIIVPPPWPMSQAKAPSLSLLAPAPTLSCVASCAARGGGDMVAARVGVTPKLAMREQ